MASEQQESPRAVPETLYVQAYSMGARYGRTRAPDEAVVAAAVGDAITRLQGGTHKETRGSAMTTTPRTGFCCWLDQATGAACGNDAAFGIYPATVPVEPYYHTEACEAHVGALLLNDRGGEWRVVVLAAAQEGTNG